jgi:signal transduction histidine kinase
LRQRIFIWFGVVILLVGSVTFGVGELFAVQRQGWSDRFEGAQLWLAQHVAEVWDRPEQRHERLTALAVALGLGFELRDASGAVIERVGPACGRGPRPVRVTRAGVELGSVSWCTPRHAPLPWPFLAGLAAALLTLWAASGLLANRLARPLQELSRVTREIGAGRLASRARLGRHQPGEVGELADSVHEMATRIERQLADQRELLAVVSHEVRTPLGHLRVLAELLREAHADPRLCEQVEQEISEIDTLVGELLASSRLDFAALDRRELDASEAALRALERAGLPATVLADDTRGMRVTADATLLARALANLLGNAERHAGGARRLALRATATHVEFLVEDAGPGFAPELLERAFESFSRGNGAPRAEARGGAGLGLGLSLVRRIAVAHGGRAWAENLPQGGARVGLSLPRAGASAP